MTQNSGKVSIGLLFRKYNIAELIKFVFGSWKMRRASASGKPREACPAVPEAPAYSGGILWPWCPPNARVNCSTVDVHRKSNRKYANEARFNLLQRV